MLAGSRSVAARLGSIYMRAKVAAISTAPWSGAAENMSSMKASSPRRIVASGTAYSKSSG
jgi:hypothetical protein